MIKKFETYSSERILGIDVDGVLNNFCKGFNAVYKRYFPKNPTIPSDDIDDWNFWQTYDYNGEDPGSWFFKTKHLGFRASKPYIGAAETINIIHDYCKKNNIMLKIVTNQPTKRSQEECLVWLDKYGFNYDDIVFPRRTKEKWEYCDVLIDDGPPVLDQKPDNKVSIKVIQKYNLNSKGDFNINSISELTPGLVGKAFEKLNISEGVKWYNKGKFEEDTEPIVYKEDSNEVWAIFEVRGGSKLFVTEIDSFDVFIHYERLVKYSNPRVMKFSLERAKELVDKNEDSDLRFSSGIYGIVNNNGVQLRKGTFNIWQKI